MGFLDRLTSPETAGVQRGIRQAQTLLHEEHPAEAESLIRQAIAVSDKALGPAHHLSATARIVLATALHAQGRYADAETEAHDLAAHRAHRPDDQLALAALALCALAVREQGDPAEALRRQDELLPFYVRIHGTEHPLTLKLRADRAHTLNRLERYEEAAAESEELLALARASKEPTAGALARKAEDGLAAAKAGQSVS
ncbi:tetratricopeptide repeat protein [Streptomyces sp. TRM66268-LWL]|uniref:Tetratricopeptide repeat protein n=1 Tax=Streptomyces polyasparticus TaxID=2767826 RepID=A0ABR7SVV2_9ACTN|nr:tetratricopeptide repeat protein [Streptomyces polyasparticus]MBC9719057.1 tetratricopeptide repeat protein [Streptomyces polyasparticus]